MRSAVTRGSTLSRPAALRVLRLVSLALLVPLGLPVLARAEPRPGAAALSAPGTSRPAPLEVVVSSAVEGEVPDRSEKRVRLGTRVWLHAAARGEDGWIADVPRLAVEPDGAPVAARPPAASDGARTVRWYRLEPAAHWISNTEPSFHFATVPYREEPLPACDDQLRCLAEVRTSVLGDRGGLGTMTFRAEVTLGGRRGSSPGLEARLRGGLGPEVARVTVRRDDTFLGFLTELYNTPYIWGSAGEPAARHQADLRIGSDCADFVTYGVRRLGHDVPYTSTFGLPDHARTLARSQGPSDDGVYRDEVGRPIRIADDATRPGDLLLFPRHVGALVRDEPPLGVLSTSDVLAHTCWSEPVEQPLVESGWADKLVQVLRFRVLDRRAVAR